MTLPTDGDFLYEELVKTDKESSNLRRQRDDLIDIVDFLRKHLAHMLANEPAIVKACAISSFDARYDCRRCASEWQSLFRFREKEKEKRAK